MDEKEWRIVKIEDEITDGEIKENGYLNWIFVGFCEADGDPEFKLKRKRIEY